MKQTRWLLVLCTTGLIAVGGYGLYFFGKQQGMKTVTEAGPKVATPSTPGDRGVQRGTGRKVLYWHDPMVPGQRFDKPGKSPFMDMQLVPVYADEAGDDGTVSISPRVQQNLGIRTAEVSRGSLAPALEVVGNVAFNERDLVLVQARSNGFIERLYVRAPLDLVKKGQPLAELYVPEWVAAQEEYFTIKRMGNVSGSEGLLDAARQRMRLAGMTDDLIRLVETSGRTRTRLTITAPISGAVAELQAREGMTVAAGALLFRINGLRSVWVEAEVPEALVAQVRPGSAIEGRTPALSGAVLKGTVGAILPRLETTTRTLKARIELENPDSQLVPGMFVTVNIGAQSNGEVLSVPSEAVIRTGKRNVVIVRQGDKGFLPVEVQVGREANGQTEIRQGLDVGQKVVVSGQFLIDSEASLKGATMRMAPMSPAEDTPIVQVEPGHRAEGTVESIDPDEVVLLHGPIPSLKWGEMTMGFKPPPGGLPKDVSVGDKVSFQIRPIKDGMFEIVTISRAGAGKGTVKKTQRPEAGR